METGAEPPETPEAPEASARAPFTVTHEKALQAVVIILGVLIVVALGGLIYGVTDNLSEQLAEEDSDNAPITSYDVEIPTPENYFFVDQDVTDGMLTVTFESGEGDYIWRIYDLDRGDLVGTITRLNPPPNESEN